MDIQSYDNQDVKDSEIIEEIACLLRALEGFRKNQTVAGFPDSKMQVHYDFCKKRLIKIYDDKLISY